MKNQQRLNDMPSPEHLFISSYKKVHNGKQSAGAYIAEIFTRFSSLLRQSNLYFANCNLYVFTFFSSVKLWNLMLYSVTVQLMEVLVLIQ